MRAKLLSLENDINSNFIARHDEIRGLMLATLSRQHILFLGPPGTAKSQLISLWAEGISSTFFRRLITQYTSPDELFGPVDIKEYKDNGIFRRIIKGKAADSEIVFLDEVFKGGSTILNSLLSLMEERIFDNDGEPVKAPLKVLIGASNEMPEDDSLMAFYDRFMLRYQIGYIEDQLAFMNLMSLNQSGLTADHITMDELTQIWAEVDAMQLGASAHEALSVLWEGLRQEDIRPSDRRYRHMVKIMAADSWLNDWPVIMPQSILVGQHILWDKPEDFNKVKRVVLGSVDPALARATDIITAAREAAKEASGQGQAAVIQLIGQLNLMKAEVERMTGDHVEGTAKELAAMLLTAANQIGI